VFTLATSRPAYRNESGRKKIEYIYKEYRRLMLSKAYGILKDRRLAEKALYEAFIQIWKNIDKFDDPGNSRSIVLAVTITRNCAYALVKGKTRDMQPVKEHKNYTARGLDDALAEMSASDIIKVVNKLGGVNKNIFLLNYAFGFTRKKTAGTLNDTETNVAARLQRAQKKLRALLLRGWD